MSMYYLDPDGNKIETQVDIFDDPQEAIAFFEGEEFATNPFGVDFDPEVLIQRLNDGEDEALLMRRANIGHRGLDSVPFPTAPESVALDR